MLKDGGTVRLAVREITKELRGVPIRVNDGDSPSLHRAWEISVGRRKVILKRYGSMCEWNKIALEKEGAEVYRIEKKARFRKGEDVGVRTEFFGDSFFRDYRGDQFSFVEYLGVAGQSERIPQREELTAKNLDGTIIKGYEEHLKQFLFN